MRQVLQQKYTAVYSLLSGWCCPVHAYTGALFPACAQSHPKFASVAGVAPLLFGRALQKSEEKAPKRLALGEAVAQRMIANETLAYFIGRTYLFMVLDMLPLCVSSVGEGALNGVSPSVPPMLLSCRMCTALPRAGVRMHRYKTKMLPHCIMLLAFASCCSMLLLDWN